MAVGGQESSTEERARPTIPSSASFSPWVIAAVRCAAESSNILIASRRILGSASAAYSSGENPSGQTPSRPSSTRMLRCRNQGALGRRGGGAGSAGGALGGGRFMKGGGGGR